MNDKVLCPHHKMTGTDLELQQAALLMSVRSAEMDEDNLFQTLTRVQIKRSSIALIHLCWNDLQHSKHGTKLNNFGFGHNDKMRV